MNRHDPIITIRAPGRICLLGEHQDYLGLEVISGALPLGITLTAVPDPRPDTPDSFDITLHQTGEHRILQARSPVDRPAPRDYLQSGLNVFLALGARFSRGWRVDVDGDLPIGKGLSSSSALCVGWAALLAAAADPPIPLTPLETAQLAFRMEV
ncbi:MAG TPA: galactokinase family protein, partial [bacterium]|nr:galactokinase family protein [bacterium]